MNRRQRSATVRPRHSGGGIGHRGWPHTTVQKTHLTASEVAGGRFSAHPKRLAGWGKAVAALLMLFPLLVGCNGSSQPSSDGDQRLKVVATVGMVGDLVREIGGDNVEVIQICRTGVDPHTYQPIRDDVVAIMEADVVFYCGLKLEGKMEEVLRKVSKDKPTVAVAASIEPSLLMTPEDASGHSDPHVWNDISLWSDCAALIGQQLAESLPQHAQEIERRTIAYRERLDELHAWGGEVMATIPEQSRLLVTSHDAFNYFGRAYGLDVMGVQGISTESEAGLRRINELVDTLIARDVKAVFVESSVPRKNIEALVEGTQSRGHKVVVGGELFSDAMGAPGTYEGTYLGMLDHNLTTAARALGGEVDAGGFQGKLSEVADSATH